MRWSGLKREIENVFSENINLQMYCTDYTTTDKHFTYHSPRYWLTLNQEVIWDFPGPFLEWKNTDKTSAVQYLDGERGTIPAILRAYLATGKRSLLSCTHSKDRFGLIDILNAADRRLGKEKLLEKFKSHMGKDFAGSPAVSKILQARFPKREQVPFFAQDLDSARTAELATYIQQQIEASAFNITRQRIKDMEAKALSLRRTKTKLPDDIA